MELGECVDGSSGISVGVFIYSFESKLVGHNFKSYATYPYTRETHIASGLGDSNLPGFRVYGSGCPGSRV